MNGFILPAGIFIIGLIIGSFLNVCIYRIPLKKTVVRGRSYCTACNALIPWYANIPVLSYIVLKGRCKDCGNPISLIYPFVELLNAICYVLIWQVYGMTFPALLFAALFSILIVISFIDLKNMIIPDGLNIAILILGIANFLFHVLTTTTSWYTFVLGFFAASVPLFILGLIYPDGMGGGDIKLMAASGLMIGWKMILLALFLAAIYGLLISLILIVTKKRSIKSVIPFGPMLSLGIMTAVLFGERMLAAYFSLFF